MDTKIDDPFDGINCDDDKKEDVDTKAAKAVKIKITKPKKNKEPLSDEDIKLKTQKLLQLRQYFNSPLISKHLKDNGLKWDKKYEKMGIEEIETNIQNIEILIANRSNNNTLNSAIHSSLRIMENNIHNRTKFKIQGMTDSLEKDDSWNWNLELIRIKYLLPFSNPDPILSCALILSQTAMLTHRMNTMNIIDTNNNIDLDVKINI